MTSVITQGHQLFYGPFERRTNMLLSLALIILTGILIGALFKKLGLPSLLGFLIAGILLGPNALNLMDQNILAISGDVREIALIIILAKAGLSLDLSDLKRIGRPAVLMCFLPATFELIGFVLFAPKLLGCTVLEAAIMGAVMGAVSPAVVVPYMSMMLDKKIGTKKGIPQMIIAGSSADDVYVIVIFTALLSFASGQKVSAGTFLQIPVSIFLGIIVGALIGILLSFLFKKIHMRDTLKVLIILAVSFLLVYQENVIKGVISISGLIALISMCILINNRRPVVAKRLCPKFDKLWVGASIFLFVLVGTLVNVRYVVSAGLAMILVLFIGLAFRSLGTLLAILGTNLNRKEKLFTIIAELPKATVQAAIGGVPLARGLSCGNQVLTMSVIAILITAPLGAILIEKTYNKLCTNDAA